MSLLTSSAENDWISPIDIIKKVKNVLGYIDLDPASSLEANIIVGANKIYTIADDMLKQQFDCGTFYMNPPFGKIGTKSQAGIFCEYVVDQYEKGNIKSGGIILVHSRLGYLWHEQLMDKLPSIILKERIKFINANTMKQGAMAKTTQTLFLVGVGFLREFINEFEEIGRLYLPKLKAAQAN
jgi:hypothetical protein